MDLRELVVRVDFSDIDTASLVALDSQVNGLEHEVNQLGHEINDATAEFAVMGAVGSTAMDDVGNQTENTTKKIKKLDGGYSNLTKSIWKWTGIIAAGTAAATAMGAPLLLVTMGLASAFAAAGIGAAAFGVVAVPMLTKVFDAASKVDQIQQKIDQAGTAKERIKAQKELAALYGNMSKAQKGALQDLQDFKKFWGSFTKQFQDPVFNIFSKGLQAAKGLLKGLAPTIKSVANVFSVLLSELNKDISGGGMKKFFDWLSTNAAKGLLDFSHIAGNLLSGVFSLLESFAPYGQTFTQSLVDMTGKFKDWAAGFGKSKDFQNFIAYAQQNGPVLIEFLGNLFKSIGNIIQALAPLGTDILNVANELTNFLANSSEAKDFFNFLSDVGVFIGEHWGPISDILIAAGSAVGVYVLAMQGMKIIGTITGLVNDLRVAYGLLTGAQWALNAAEDANPIGAVILAIAALIGIGVLLYKNWDTIKAKAGALWNVMSAVWDGIKSAGASAWGSIERGAATAINSVIDDINKLIRAINRIPGFNIPIIPKVNWGAVKTLRDGPVKRKSVTNSLSGPQLMSHATGLERVPWDNYGANLHKDEAVLTAQQSNALRNAGILGSNGSKPTLDMNEGIKPNNSGNNRPGTFAPVVQITVDGRDKNDEALAATIAAETQKAMDKFWRQMVVQEA